MDVYTEQYKTNSNRAERLGISSTAGIHTLIKGYLKKFSR